MPSSLMRFPILIGLNVFIVFLVFGGMAYAEDCQRDANGECKSDTSTSTTTDTRTDTTTTVDDGKTDTTTTVDDGKTDTTTTVDDGKTDTTTSSSSSTTTDTRTNTSTTDTSTSTCQKDANGDCKSDSTSSSSTSSSTSRSSTSTNTTGSTSESKVTTESTTSSTSSTCEKDGSGECKDSTVSARTPTTDEVGKSTACEKDAAGVCKTDTSTASQLSTTSSAIVSETTRVEVVDGAEVEIVEKIYQEVTADGRIVTTTQVTRVDSATGASETTATTFTSDAKDAVSIVDSFTDDARDALTSAILSGTATDEQERLIASLSDEEKTTLFSTRDTASLASTALSSLTPTAVAASLSLEPKMDLAIGASGDDSSVKAFNPAATAQSVQAATKTIVSVAAAGAAAAGAAAAGAAAAGAAGGLASAGAGAAAGLGAAGGPIPSGPGGGLPAPGPDAAVSRPGGGGRISPSASAGTGGDLLTERPRGGTGAGGGGRALDETVVSYAEVNEDVFDAVTSADYDGRSSGGTGAGGGGASSASEAGGFVDVEVSTRGELKRRRKDARFSFFGVIDFLYRSLGSKLRSVPLLARILDDSNYIRAFAGPMYLFLPASAVALGYWGSITNDLGILHPPLMIFFALILIGVFDSFSGALGIVVFFALSANLIHASSVDDWRTVVGVLLSTSASGLMSRSISDFRNFAAPGLSGVLRMLGKASIAALVGGWIASILVRSLPSLSGLTLPAANHVDFVHIVVSAALFVRVLIEYVASRWLPDRMDKGAIEIGFLSSGARGLLWILFRVGFFIFLGSAFLGWDWRTLLVAAFVAAPAIISRLEQKLPGLKFLWTIMPFGVFSMVVILSIEVVLEGSLSSRLGDHPDFSTIFVLSLTPLVALFALMQAMAKAPSNGAKHWWAGMPRFVQIGGALLSFLSLFGVTRLL